MFVFLCVFYPVYVFLMLRLLLFFVCRVVLCFFMVDDGCLVGCLVMVIRGLFYFYLMTLLSLSACLLPSTSCVSSVCLFLYMFVLYHVISSAILSVWCDDYCSLFFRCVVVCMYSICFIRLLDCLIVVCSHL